MSRITDGWPVAEEGEDGATYLAKLKGTTPDGTTPKPRRKSPEADIQAELVAHVSGPRAIERLIDGAIVHSHPNEATRDNAKFRAMGVYRGISDLEFNADGGLAYFMEVKAPGEHLTDDQRAFRDWCRAHRTPWAMCDSVFGGLEQLRRWGLLRERS